MTTTAEILRGLPYFSDLPEELIESVCGGSTQITLEEGDVIIKEGSESEEMYVLVEGELIVSKLSGDKDVELARILPGEVVGEIALLDQAPRTATVAAAMNSLAVRIPVAAFEALLSDSRVVRRMFKTVTSRLRGIEETLRHEERMAALGRMAAQLMHELNNPAAAVGRTSQELRRLHEELGREAGSLTTALAEGLDIPEPEPADAMSAMDRSDAEDDVAVWLEDVGLDDAWEVAPSLVDAGWTTDHLSTVANSLEPDVAPHMLRWIALRTMSDQVISEVSIGAKRISELVRIVKEYSYLDQAPIQEINPTAGIQDTLVLLKHKLGDITVSTDFADDLAMVEAPGRDLNQVWTNLIDNASDAMSEGGELLITARNETGFVVIEVRDNGEGMPPGVAEKVFDPFFTTKEPGKGTGLGLHTVHNIITKAGGEIDVSSSSEGTKFTIKLPTAST